MDEVDRFRMELTRIYQSEAPQSKLKSLATKTLRRKENITFVAWCLSG
jgi:hypothetical protein